MTDASDHSQSAQSRRDSAGFSLIEMLAVVAVIAIIASIAIPAYMSRKIAANEAGVIAALKTIVQSQFQFKAMRRLDLNKDSAAEYATLPELGGAAPVRGSSDPLKPLLSPTLGLLDGDGHSQKHGYYLCLYLPDDEGKGVVGNSIHEFEIDPLKAKDFWTCTAWPRTKGKSGNLTFFVNQQGEILKTRYPVYSGKSNVPPAGAGLAGVDADKINTQSLAADTVGADGSLWIVVN